MWRYLLPLTGFVVLAVVFFVGLKRDPSEREIPSPLIGKPAPAFTLPSVHDPARAVSTKDFQGRMYALNVWATWCGGCREEHAVLLSIAKSGAVPLVGLDWKDDRGEAQRWLKVLGNPYTDVAFDPEGNVAIDWGVYGAPETFLVNARGEVVHKQIGPLTVEIWQRDFVPRISAAAKGAGP